MSSSLSANTNHYWHYFTFDGLFSAGEWDNIEPIQLTVQTPHYRGEPSERTEIRMAYDANYIYISGAMYDSEAHKIMANNVVRLRHNLIKLIARYFHKNFVCISNATLQVCLADK